MTSPIMKRGRFECEALRAFHKRQHCAGCGLIADDPHHHPTLGAGGDDFGIIPTWRVCHGRMQGYSHGFNDEYQTELAHDALVNFLRNANELERKAFIAAWERYIEARVFVEVPA